MIGSDSVKYFVEFDGTAWFNDGTREYDILREKPHFKLMQFTGLYEHCNDDTALNKEIYEGDLVQFHNGQILAVEWNDDICQWQYSDGPPIHSGDSYGCFRRVVGNIYENPELLNSNA